LDKMHWENCNFGDKEYDERDNIGKVYGEQYGDEAFKKVQNWKKEKQVYLETIVLLKTSQREYPDAVLKKERKDAIANLEMMVETISIRLKKLSNESKPKILYLNGNAPKDKYGGNK